MRNNTDTYKRYKVSLTNGIDIYVSGQNKKQARKYCNSEYSGLGIVKTIKLLSVMNPAKQFKPY